MTDCTDIFDRLEKDHDRHRALLDLIEDTHGASDERSEHFEKLTLDIKAHAAAEEQALYSTMLRKPPTTGDTRHSVAEHHELDEMLNDLAATDMSSSAWLTKFKEFAHRYRHHIDEEEDEHFPEFAQHLTDADARYMREVFERRKSDEKAKAEITPEKMEDAKE
ncbi:MAG: hemerythrin domain-containing protein [Sphingomonadales bacterium]|nr:hemerythrin domain-containing protein [Sphingomonadales bacterium]MBD3774106.1 hemerythrin domain-containing protein [Paracoccaceae bacterium]